MDSTADYLSTRARKTLTAAATKKTRKLSPADRRFARLMISDAFTEWNCQCPSCQEWLPTSATRKDTA